jgi:hypothetical protein
VQIPGLEHMGRERVGMREQNGAVKVKGVSPWEGWYQGSLPKGTEEATLTWQSSPETSDRGHL